MEEVANPPVAFQHADAIELRHRFPEIVFRGETWDLRHLNAHTPSSEMSVHLWRYRQRKSMRTALNGACCQRSDTIFHADFSPDLSRTLQRGRSDTPETIRSTISPPRLPAWKRRACTRCFSRLSAIIGGSGDYYFTFSQLTDWSASRTDSQRRARCGLPLCSERPIRGDDPLRDSWGQKGQRPPLVAVACEALYRVLREFPLQVGPGEPGGTAFCTRSWQLLHASIGTDLARSSHRVVSPRQNYSLIKSRT